MQLHLYKDDASLKEFQQVLTATLRSTPARTNLLAQALRSGSMDKYLNKTYSSN